MTPGSVIPVNININTDANRSKIMTILITINAFDVFSSPWFSTNRVLITVSWMTIGITVMRNVIVGKYRSEGNTQKPFRITLMLPVYLSLK